LFQAVIERKELDMAQRSILAGSAPRVVVRSGKDIEVKGWDSDRLLVDSSGLWGLELKKRGDTFEVQVGGSGQVLVPAGSSVVVYAGKSAQVREVRGTVSAVAGADLLVQAVNVLAQASAGGEMEIDCQQVAGSAVVFTAGRSLRCRVRADQDVHYVVEDIAGPWEAVLGSAEVRITLKAGGSATLVTESAVAGQPPLYVVGSVERPQAEPLESGEGHGQ
jgi:hypothetical protein